MRLYSSLCLVLVLFFTHISQAQEVLNLSASSNVANEIVYSILRDDNNNCTYIAGSLDFEELAQYSSDNLLTENFPQGTIFNTIFNNVQNLGGADAFIAKINSDNTIQWITTAGGTGTDFYKSLSLDLEGNLIAVGALSLPCTFYYADGFVDNSYNNTASNLAAAMCRYSPDGNLIWANFLSTNGDNVATSVESTESSLVISGNFFNSSSLGSNEVDFFGFQIEETDSPGSFIAFFDYDGNCNSFKTYLSSNYNYTLLRPETLGTSIAFNNNKLVHCQYMPDQEIEVISSENLAAQLIDNLTPDNLFIRAYDSMGTELWSVKENFTESIEIKSDPSIAINCESLFLCFSFLGDQTIQSFTPSYQSILSGDLPNIALSKHTLTDGGLEALNIIGTDDSSGNTIVTSIDVSETEVVYLAGIYQNNLSLSSAIANPSAAFSEEGWVSAFDLNLNSQWYFLLIGNQQESIMDIQSANFSTLYFGGTTSSNQINNLVFSLPVGSSHSVMGKIINNSDNDNSFSIQCPENISINSTNECGAEGVILDLPIISSNCYLQFLSNDAPSLYPLGVTTVIHQATSISGITRQCFQQVTVIDVSLPEQILCAATLSLETTAGSCSAFASPALPQLVGFCEPPEITNSISGNTLLSTDFPIGTTSIEWSVTNEFGEVLQCTSTVEVEDIEEPVALCNAIQLELDTDGNASVTIAEIDNGSFDSCSDISYDLSQTTFACADLGISSVLLTVTDESGNSASCEAEVLVMESNESIAINAGENITICSTQAAVELEGTSSAPSTTWSGGTGNFAEINSPITTYTLGSDEFLLENIILSLNTSSASGCSIISDEIIITIDQNPKLEIEQPLLGCIGETVSLNPLASNASAFLWSSSEITFNGAIDSQNNSITIPLDAQIDQQYILNLEITSLLEVCEPINAELTVKVEECIPPEPFKIPTGFSPNGDNINDTFFINEIEIHAPINLQVYNKWGFMVYNSENYLNDWNGLDQDGNELPIDSYFGVISGKGLPQTTLTITINR